MAETNTLENSNGWSGGWYNAPAQVAVVSSAATAITSPGSVRIRGSEVADVSTHAPAIAPYAGGNADPSLTTNSFFDTPDNQMAGIQKTYTVHQQMDMHLENGYVNAQRRGTGSLNPASVIKANQVAHQVLHELLRGTMVLRVPPDEIMALLDHIRDHAVHYVCQLDNAGQFDATHLKNNILNHPKVRSFKERHDPRHTHWTHILHHPDTGMPSNTVIAAHVKHDELLDRLFHDNHHEYLHGG